MTETMATNETNHSNPPLANAETVVRKRVLRELPVKLTDRELLDVAKQKSDAESELEELQAEFAETKREWNARIEAIETRIARHAAEFREGTQKRPVECHERYVREGEHAGKVETVRLDIGEVVDRRVADLLEARNALPKDEADAQAEIGDEILAEAARLQQEAGVEETEDGDVVVPDAAAPKSKKKGKRS
jgi:hypothetical protein